MNTSLELQYYQALKHDITGLLAEAHPYEGLAFNFGTDLRKTLDWFETSNMLVLTDSSDVVWATIGTKELESYEYYAMYGDETNDETNKLIKVMTIHSLFVRRSVRHHGLAQLLLSAAFKRAAQRVAAQAIHSIILEILPDVDANQVPQFHPGCRNLWMALTHQGFREIGMSIINCCPVMHMGALDVLNLAVDAGSTSSQPEADSIKQLNEK